MEAEASKRADQKGGRHIRAAITKKGLMPHKPRTPSKESKKYATAYYQQYDASKHLRLTPPPKSGNRELSMSLWEGYPLYSEECIIDSSYIPISCRLDDLTVANLLDIMTGNILHAGWPTEFDANGMIKAQRMPLGYAAKMYVVEGMVDRNGKIASRDAED